MKIFKSLKEEYLQEGVYDPGIFKAYFLAGGPGSGKSFVTAGAFAGLGLKLVNSDDVLTKYLNAEGLSLKMPEKEKEKRDELRQKAKITTTENIVRTSWATTQNNMGRYQKLFQPANFYVIDNSSSEKELVTTTLNKAAGIVRRTMNQPHNFIAKQWIERQLRIKRR
jgi:predicted ABC-type ATPase